jgi:long-chain acyl-CoA synthetase
VVSLDQVAARGRARLASDPAAAADRQGRIDAVKPTDLATIIYTSGTTGEPKGVMLSHDNIVSNVLGSVKVLPQFDRDDVGLTFLPLSHAFERTAIYMYLHQGLTIVFAESLDTIGRDMAAERPTVMTGVPRVYEKLRARILASIAKETPARQRVLLADRLVFSAIRARLGGRLRYLVSGSAPLSPTTTEFFFALGLPIYEGYGLTETSPVLTVNPPDAPRVGTVGRPIPGVEIRIAEDGEILARGPNVMQGYYNRPAETAEVLRDGWFHTGDIGRLDSEGYLSITDRRKELIVTAGGKKIAPAPLEHLLRASPLVAEAVIIGDRRPFPAALIVPNYPILESRLRELGRPIGAYEALAEREDVRGLYQELVDAVNRDLAQFERIKKIVLLSTEFSIASGELTPTLKVKRRVVAERWQHVIEGIYRDTS